MKKLFALLMALFLTAAMMTSAMAYTAVTPNNNQPTITHTLELTNDEMDSLAYDIEYRLLGLEELATLAEEGPFDMVISSLALHYVADISKVFSDVADLLVEGGEFVFSMEHPIYTAPGHDGGKWECLPDGTKTGFV